MEPNHVQQQQPQQGEAYNGREQYVAGMEAELYRAATSGSIEAMRDIPNWMDQETPTQNSVLHLHVEKSPLFRKVRNPKRPHDAVDDSEFVKYILDDNDGYWLLWKQNSNGDTPLHLAAKFGYSDAVEAFLDRAKKVYQPADEVTRILSIANKKKETALHEAARAGHAQVVKRLVQADRNCSSHTQPNKDYETPLYLAAESGSTPSVVTILQASDDASHLAYRGPCGRTVLHAAVQWGDPEMVKNILMKRALFEKWIPSLEKRFLIWIPDEEGLTPLHCAAGEVFKVQLLDILLYCEKECCYSAVYIRDNMGRTPIHIAMLRKNWKAIDNLIKSRPDCTEIVDNEGQNVLHYAAKWSHFLILGGLLQRHYVVRKLIYDKDVNGNTPFHLLVASVNKNGTIRSPSFIRHLPRFVRKNPSINFKAFNNQNLTVGDMLLTCDDLLRQEDMFEGRQAKLFPRGRRINTYEGDVDVEKASVDIDNRFGEWNVGSMKKAAQSRLVVAALIATISFTAGFTVPGGFDQNAGKNMGMAVFKSKTSFGVFLVSDAIAFTCSILAILCYFALVSTDAKRVIGSLSIYGFALNTVSLGALMIAFIAAVSAILPKSSGLVHFTYAISVVFFLLYSFLFIRAWKARKWIRWYPQLPHNQRLLH